MDGGDARRPRRLARTETAYPCSPGGRRTPPRHRVLGLCLVALVPLLGCASGQQSGATAPVTRPAPREAEKTLTVVIQREPASFNPQITQDGGGARGGGVNQIGPMVDDVLAVDDEAGVRQPRMAQEIPSQAAGTWVLNPDGSMDLTWRLRPSASWHDGTPLTSGDFAFGLTVVKELGLAASGGGRPDLITGVTPIDARTFVIHWSGVYVNGNLGSIVPLPRHILEASFLEDRESITVHRHFTAEYVGTGPFRLVEWVRGSHLELARHEGFHLGKPAISRLFVRFVPDTNTMALAILAESVDVVLPEGVDLDTAIEIRERWKGTGHQVNAYVLGVVVQMELMLNPEYARPVNGWTQIPARQGLYQALDRPAIAEVLTAGLSPPADSMYAPDSPYLPMVRDHIPLYPYDARRAQQLLEGAGWAPGADGVLVHRPSGERFDTVLMVPGGSQSLKLGSMIREYWKAVGLNVTLESLTPANASDVQYISTRSGPLTHNPTGANFYESRLHSMRIPTAANRYTGNNRGHFNSPVVDDIIERLAYTIDPDQQAQLHRQFLAETMGKVTQMPLYWETLPILMLRGVSGPRIFGGVATRDIHLWDRS